MFKKKGTKISDDIKQKILQKIKPLIAQQLKINEEKITLEAKIDDDLGADPLDVTELIMALEDTFKIQVLDEDLEEMKTVEDIVIYLTKRVQI